MFKSDVIFVNILGYWGKRRIPIKIHTIIPSGAVASYSKISENEGKRYFPLIQNNKNIEPFELKEKEFGFIEQLKLNI